MEHHPAVLLVGPRACGKTTTARRRSRTILHLDRPKEAAAVAADPDAVLAQSEEPILLDEWQAQPSVLGAVKRAVDADPRPGRFIITGSVRGEIDGSTWPGTGRLIRIPMFGLTIAEQLSVPQNSNLLSELADGDVARLLKSLPDAPTLPQYLELALRGGFPEPALRLQPSERGAWMQSYLDQLLAHDVTHRVGRRDRTRLRRYLEAFALNTAGLPDRQTIDRAAGVSKATGESYEELLRSLVLIETVPAWWTNRIKRLAQSPKRYVIDPALALCVLRMDAAGVLRDGDLLGRILDTFIVAQLRVYASACEREPRLHHLRHAGGREVDLIVEYGGGRVFAFEFKTTSAPTSADARHLRWLRDAIGDRFIGGAVLHTGPRPFMLDETIVAAPIASLWGNGRLSESWKSRDGRPTQGQVNTSVANATQAR